MAEFRRVNDEITVSPQIAPSDLAAVAAQGFKLVINNRPDGEDPAQPSSAEMEAAARAAGLAYAYIPVRGAATAEQVAEQRELAAKAGGPVFAFCRSGTRSITTWARGEAQAGAKSRDDLLALASNAGYDLSAAL